MHMLENTLLFQVGAFLAWRDYVKMERNKQTQKMMTFTAEILQITININPSYAKSADWHSVTYPDAKI